MELRSARKRRTTSLPEESKSEHRMKTRADARKETVELTKSSEEEEDKEKIVFEFGGPIGVVLTMIFLPIVIMGLSISCDTESCLGVDLSLWSFFNEKFPQKMMEIMSKKHLSSASMIFFGWMSFQMCLYLLLPGPKVEGTPLRTSKEKLEYKLNGHLAFWITLFVMGHAWPTKSTTTQSILLGQAPLEYLYEYFEALAFIAILMSTIFALVLYIASFRLETNDKNELLAVPGSTGNYIYDFFMGRELNPRLYNFDFKFFCELRPGLLGWLMINIGCLIKQQNTLGFVTWPMIFIVFSQGLYVWDALFFEKAILTTMDITTDGFGFMLVFGDLAWVPFTYSLQAKFLATRDIQIPPLCLLAIALLKFFGYFIFRGANSEKDFFRSHTNIAIKKYNAQILQTKRGTKLLISGFWGLARKINYTGDWLMSLSWCLATGFRSPIPYFYCTYFLILLIHRAIRDDHACAQKYGADWISYKKHVPYLFIPKIF